MKIENKKDEIFYVSEGSNVDFDSMLDPEEEPKDIKIKKRTKENMVVLSVGSQNYSGNLKKFILKQTPDGKKIIKVVFELGE